MKKYRVTIIRKDKFTVEAVSEKEAIAKALESFKKNIIFNAEHYPDNLFQYDTLNVKEINVKK